MANRYYTILTAYGLARDAASQLGGVPINLTTMSVGDGAGNDVQPDEAMTSLVRERYRAPVNRIYPDADNPNKYIAELSIPADAAGFTMREVGLWDDEGQLFAVGNLPPTYKPNASEGAFSDAFVRMIIIVSNATVVSVQVDPNVAVASQSWVVNYITPAVTLPPGGLTNQVLGKQSNADGDAAWMNAADAVTVLVETIEENQVLAAGQTLVDLETVSTQGLAVYIDGERLRADQWVANTPTQIQLVVAAAGSEKITLVQNEQTGMVDVLRGSLNLADVHDKAAARNNLGLPAWIATVTIDWGKVGNKPVTFPPSVHAHAIDDVNGLTSALNGKVDTSTAVTAGTGLTGGGALSTSRTLAIDFATNLQSVANKAVQANDGRLSDARPPTSHTHAIAQVSGLQGVLDGKQPNLGFTPVRQGGASGMSSAAVYVGAATSGGGLLGQVGSTALGKFVFDKDFTYLHANNGWERLPSGLILQWGRYEAGSPWGEGAGPTIAFPRQFTSACFGVFLTDIGTGDTYADLTAEVVKWPSTSQFSTFLQWMGGVAGSNKWYGMTWWAIGV